MGVRDSSHIDVPHYSQSMEHIQCSIHVDVHRLGNSKRLRFYGLHGGHYRQVFAQYFAVEQVLTVKGIVLLETIYSAFGRDCSNHLTHNILFRCIHMVLR